MTTGFGQSAYGHCFALAFSHPLLSSLLFHPFFSLLQALALGDVERLLCFRFLSSDFLAALPCASLKEQDQSKLCVSQIALLARRW